MAYDIYSLAAGYNQKKKQEKREVHASVFNNLKINVPGSSTVF
jgi:hypothetical protein